MNTEASHTPFIRIIGEGPQREVAMRLSTRNLADGEAFAREYLSDHPMRWEGEGYTDQEVDLLGAAFVKIAGSLPIFSYDLIRWTDETCMFDGGTAMREYAEKNLGMASKNPDRRNDNAELERAIAGVSAERLASVIPSYLDGDDISELINLLQAEMDQRKRSIRITVDDLPHAMKKAAVGDVIWAIHERFEETEMADIAENLQATLENLERSEREIT